jgi:hypothetical protein
MKIRFILPVLTLVLAFGSIVYAWTGPTASPPNNNTPAPINIGAMTQTKVGDICTSAGGGKCLSTVGGSLISCAAASGSNWMYGGLVCCKIDPNNGSSSCRYEAMNQWGWADYPYGGPFSASSAGTYSISCAISSNQNFAYGGLVCCRYDQKSSSSSCMESAIGQWGWIDIGGPF